MYAYISKYQLKTYMYIVYIYTYVCMCTHHKFWKNLSAHAVSSRSEDLGGTMMIWGMKSIKMTQHTCTPLHLSFRQLYLQPFAFCPLLHILAGTHKKTFVNFLGFWRRIHAGFDAKPHQKVHILCSWLFHLYWANSRIGHCSLLAVFHPPAGEVSKLGKEASLLPLLRMFLHCIQYAILYLCEFCCTHTHIPHIYIYDFEYIHIS